jgi:hypothetical protein
LEKGIMIKFAKIILRMLKMKKVAMILILKEITIIKKIVIGKKGDLLISKFSNKKYKVNKHIKFKKIKLINMLFCLKMH